MIKKLKLCILFILFFSCLSVPDISDIFSKNIIEFENIANSFGNQNKIGTLIVWSDKNFRIDTKDYSIYINDIYYFGSEKFSCVNYVSKQKNFFKSKIDLFNFINIKESDYKQFFDFLKKNKIGGVQKNFYDSNVIEFIEGNKYMMHNNGLCYSPKLELDKLSASELKKYYYSSVKRTYNQNWYSYVSI